MPDQMPLVKGTLDVLILKALMWAPMHGFEITTWLENQSGGALGIRDSALYQALHRMEERDLIVAEWGVTTTTSAPDYYRVTKAGRAHLAAETAQWVRYANTVTGSDLQAGSCLSRCHFSADTRFALASGASFDSWAAARTEFAPKRMRRSGFISLRTEQLIRGGLSPDAARVEAERRFGQTEQHERAFTARRSGAMIACAFGSGGTPHGEICSLPRADSCALQSSRRRR